MAESARQRIVIVTGSAGCGSTSVAGALAAQAAARGSQVAVLVGDSADRVAAGSATVVEVDPLAWAERTWQQVAGLRMLAAAPWSGIGPSDLLPIAGLEQIAWWGVLREVRRRSFDTVVVDAGPIGSALSWLTLPDTICGALRRAWPMAQRTSVVAGGVPEQAWHLRTLEIIDSEADELASMLRSPATSLQLVTRPREHELGGLLRRLSTLSLFELPATDLVLNHCSPRREYDTAVAQHLRASLPHMRVRQARPRRRGPAALELAGEVYPRGIEPGRAPRPGITRDGEHYLWNWTLPFADPSHARARISGQDAILTVGRARRVVPLPSVLRRCRLAGATLDSGVLHLRFVPDPAVWPSTWEVS